MSLAIKKIDICKKKIGQIILILIVNHLPIWWSWLEKIHFEEELEKFEGSFEGDDMLDI